MLRWSKNYELPFVLFLYKCRLQSVQAAVGMILPMLFTQGANRMRGRLGSVDSFERSNSLASEKVSSHSSRAYQTLLLAKATVKHMHNYFVISFFLFFDK